MSKYLQNSPAGDPTDLLAMIAELRRRIEFLEKGARGGFTSIDQGSLMITSGSLTVGEEGNIYMGPVTIGGDVTPGWIYRRDDGTICFELAGAAADDQYFAFRDNDGNIIISDDGQSNQGLGRPYLPFQFYEHSNTVPVLTTTSGTFTSLQTGRFYKQHPRIRVEVLVRSSDGSTTGEVQLRNGTDNIAPIGGDVQTVAAGFYGLKTFGPHQITGNFLDLKELEVQARRTGGAGTIGVRVYTAYGVQS